jgi:tetratricopeptide (TPR) repeat protein
VAYEISPSKPHFVDRVPERARAFRAVDEWREPFRPLCIALSGMAGIGKTELAYQFVRELRPHFPDGVLRVDLDESRVRGAVDLMDVMGSLVRGLGVAPEWAGHSLADRRRRFQTKTEGLRLAVIIDNARYASEVEPLLPASGASVVVVTSRGPLADLEAGAAVEIPLGPLGERDAMDLLLRVADDPRLAADPGAASELARLCDGLPLAIRVAACLVRGHRRRSLPALLGEFRGRLHEEGLSAVEGIWDAACEALGPDAACLYRLLADAPGSTFTEDSAAAILGRGRDSAEAALEELDAAALVVNVTDDSGNARMLLPAPLRAHARRRARRHGDQEELAAAQQRAVSWYLRQAQRADARAAGSRLTLATPVAELPGAPDVPLGNAFEWLEAERHALYGCVAIAYARGLDTEAWSLCEPLFTHYLDHPHYADVSDAFRTGLAAAQRAGHVPAVVRMRCQLAFAYWDNGRFGEAAGELDQALAASHALGSSDGDRKLQASVTEFRGRLHGAEGEWGDAAADFEDALAVHEAIGNEYGVALLSYRLGQALARLGEAGRAAELLERAHSMAGLLGRERLAARVGSALADVLRGLGQAERARELYLASLASARTRRSDFDEARVLEALAALADEAGDAAAGLRYRAGADDIRARNGAGSS